MAVAWRIFYLCLVVFWIQCSGNSDYLADQDPTFKEKRVKKVTALKKRVVKAMQSLESCNGWKIKKVSRRNAQAWVCQRCMKINDPERSTCSTLGCHQYDSSALSFREQKKVLKTYMENLVRYLQANQEQKDLDLSFCNRCGYIASESQTTCKICSAELSQNHWQEADFSDCWNRVTDMLEHFESLCLPDQKDLELEKKRVKKASELEAEIRKVIDQLSCLDGIIYRWKDKEAWVCENCMKINAENRYTCSTFGCNYRSHHCRHEEQRQTLLSSMKCMLNYFQEVQKPGKERTVGCCAVCGYFTTFEGIESDCCKICNTDLSQAQKGLDDFAVSCKYATEVLKRVEQLCLPAHTGPTEPQTCIICQEEEDIDNAQVNRYQMDCCSTWHHVTCLADWLAEHPKCPICTHAVSADDVSRIKSQSGSIPTTR